ncbi:MAG: hypothetical protein IPK61_05195 [Saprospiraceae bacterium]|nr:hypothetical protein [Saprospiraceae bacterium]MBK7796731.1 hypothetical protein [Saprospiraceae bacterium]MBK8152505.1 hypothetical protein [Saprospiraceae bacterium]MBK9378618.1 hypothetical protein [Saprospiraceae bacterium]
MDTVNLNLLLSYLNNKLPNVYEVGERGAIAIAFILVHSEKLEHIEYYLSQMLELCKQGLYDWKLYAMMFDKACFLKKIPQKFGTQYILKSKEIMQLYEMEDLSIVNFNRIKIGLNPIKKDQIFQQINIKK